VLLGALGVALCRGVQRHAMACVKHFALNSMENARFSVDVTIAPRPLHEVYLPHFKQVVDAGVAGVMSAYNSVNGEWCGQNRTLLTDILKQRWGFAGFVMTDFVMGLRDAKTAILAGQDLEMPFQMHFAQGPRARRRARRGADRRGSTTPRAGSSPSSAGSARRARSRAPCSAARAPRARARGRAQGDRAAPERARRAAALGRERIALFGPLAATPNLGDRGSSDGGPRTS
jgi:beta-glucosidase